MHPMGWKLVSMLGELAAFAGVGIGIGAIFQGLEKKKSR